MDTIKGGCLCGAVRYVANAKPIVTRACWCKLCQTLAAGNATINLAFPVDALSITGVLKDFSGMAESGNRMHRRFCPECGVHLFSAAEERPHLIVVRAGTLDDPAQVVLDGIIWTSEAPAWAYLNPELPQFDKQPPAPQINSE